MVPVVGRVPVGADGSRPDEGHTRWEGPCGVVAVIGAESRDYRCPRAGVAVLNPDVIHRESGDTDLPLGRTAVPLQDDQVASATRYGEIADGLSGPANKLQGLAVGCAFKIVEGVAAGDEAGQGGIEYYFAITGGERAQVPIISHRDGFGEATCLGPQLVTGDVPPRCQIVVETAHGAIGNGQVIGHIESSAQVEVVAGAVDLQVVVVGASVIIDSAASTIVDHGARVGIRKCHGGRYLPAQDVKVVVCSAHGQLLSSYIQGAVIDSQVAGNG
ncbi:hypothetical protein ES703_115274 [subsurface metagenome]